MAIQRGNHHTEGLSVTAVREAIITGVNGHINGPQSKSLHSNAYMPYMWALALDYGNRASNLLSSRQHPGENLLVICINKSPFMPSS